MSPSPAADFLLLDPEGLPSATIAVRARLRPWEDAWDDVRETLFASAEDDGSATAVLVTPTEVTVWEHDAAPPPGGWKPAAKFPAGPLLAPVLDGRRSQATEDEGLLKSLVASLLIVLGSDRPVRVGPKFGEAARYLDQHSSGLTATLRAGRLKIAYADLMPAGEAA